MIEALETDGFGLLLENDRLPLILLRERRRELVFALSRNPAKISQTQLAEIAAIQQAIRAVETVISE